MELKFFVDQVLCESLQLFRAVNSIFLGDFEFSLKLFFLKVGEVETRLKFLEFFLKFADFFLPFQQEVFVLVSFEFGGSEHTFNGKLLVKSGVSQLIFEFDVLIYFSIDLAQKFIIRVEVLDELAWRALVHTSLHFSHVLVFHHGFT